MRRAPHLGHPARVLTARVLTVRVLLAGVALAPSARASAQQWGAGLTAGAETGTITNPRYQAAGDSTDVVSRARLGVGVTRRAPRTTLLAAAHGDWQRFRSAAGLSQRTGGASIGAERRVTPRLTARGGLAAQTLLSRGVVMATGLAPATPATPGDDASGDGFDLPAVDGLPILPLARTRTSAATTGAELRASARTTLTADGGLARVSFDAPGLAGGTNVQARLRAVRQFTGDDLVGLAVQSERTTLGGQRPVDQRLVDPPLPPQPLAGRPLTTQSALVDWTTARLPGALRLRLAAGVSVFAPAPRTVATRPVGGAELGGAALEGAWAVRYARSVSPAFGLGQIVASDQAGASYARVVPGGLVTRLGYDRAWLHTPALPGGRLVTAVSTAEVQRAIVAGLWAGVSGARYTRAQGPAVRSRDLTLRAGYAHAWGAARGATAVSRPSRHP